VDLCSNPACLASRVEKEGILAPHVPEHRLVKLRINISKLYYSAVIRAADKAHHQIEQITKRLVEQDRKVNTKLSDSEGAHGQGNGSIDASASAETSKEVSLPNCSICEGPLGLPFWYCLKCDGWSNHHLIALSRGLNNYRRGTIFDRTDLDMRLV
jgi:hypothetical protein